MPVYLTATMHYQDSAGSGDHRVMLGGMLEWQFRNAARAWTIGPIIEVRRSSGDRNDTVVRSGIIFRHGRGRWDTTSVLFRQLPSDAPGSWNYGARLRYRLSPYGRIGAEVFGAVDRVASSDLMIGYYGDITNHLSFRLLAGARLNDSDSRSARMDLVWQIN